MAMLWQRFTERAKRVVIAAQEESAHAGEPYVSPEHLLLGLVKEEDSVATRVLERLGADPARVRQEVERQIGGRARARLNNNDVTLDPRMKRVLDFAYDEARQSNTNYIGTEHLLLGIIREGDGIAYRTLAKLGVDLFSVRKEIRAYLGGEQAQPVRPRPLKAVIRVRKFAEPEEAEVWLNTLRNDGFKTSFVSTTAGMLWVVAEGKVRAEDASADADPFSILPRLSRFTDPVKQALLDSIDLAAESGEAQVLPEHLLITLLRAENSVAAGVLQRVGVTVGQVETELALPVHPSIDKKDMKLDPRLGQVLDLAFVEARERHYPLIGAEQLLLGILREGEGPAYQALIKLGADPTRVSSEIAGCVDGRVMPAAERVRTEPVSRVRRFAEASEAEEWLNTLKKDDFQSSLSTSAGMLWVISEGEAPVAAETSDDAAQGSLPPESSEAAAAPDNTESRDDKSTPPAP